MFYSAAALQRFGRCPVIVERVVVEGEERGQQILPLGYSPSANQVDALVRFIMLFFVHNSFAVVERRISTNVDLPVLKQQ